MKVGVGKGWRDRGCVATIVVQSPQWRLDSVLLEPEAYQHPSCLHRSSILHV